WPRSRPDPGGCGPRTSGSGPSWARRPRTRPWRRPSPRPGWWRRRSTRCGRAGSRGSAPRAAPPAPPPAAGGAARRRPRPPRAPARRSVPPARAGAASRRAQLDAPAAALRQELAERRVLGCAGRYDELGRNARGGAVVLEAEGLDERGHVLAADVLEVEAVAIDQLPVPEREDLHGCAVAAGRDSDHVRTGGAARVRRLPFGQMPDREQAVAVAGGVFEPLGRRGRLHLRLELAHDRTRV